MFRFTVRVDVTAFRLGILHGIRAAILGIRVDVRDEIYWSSGAHHDVSTPNEFALALRHCRHGCELRCGERDYRCRVPLLLQHVRHSYPR